MKTGTAIFCYALGIGWATAGYFYPIFMYSGFIILTAIAIIMAIKGD